MKQSMQMFIQWRGNPGAALFCFWHIVELSTANVPVTKRNGTRLELMRMHVWKTVRQPNQLKTTTCFMHMSIYYSVLLHIVTACDIYNNVHMFKNSPVCILQTACRSISHYNLRSSLSGSQVVHKELKYVPRVCLYAHRVCFTGCIS